MDGADPPKRRVLSPTAGRGGPRALSSGLPAVSPFLLVTLLAGDSSILTGHRHFLPIDQGQGQISRLDRAPTVSCPRQLQPLPRADHHPFHVLRRLIARLPSCPTDPKAALPGPRSEKSSQSTSAPSRAGAVCGNNTPHQAA